MAQINSAWTPLGGNTTYFNIGGRTGQAWTPQGGNTTYFSGDLFRGGLGNCQSGKSLFETDSFKGKIDENAISSAIEMRNIDALLSSAWDLKGFEIINNTQDTQLTSGHLFNLAAQIAVEQNNVEALKAVIALAPECKRFEEQLALKAQTRGEKKNITATAFPELVLLPIDNWEKALTDSLKPWQQPVADIYLCKMFRGMNEPTARYAADLINSGRTGMNPTMLATGAVQLAYFDYTKDYSPWFDPAKIMAEAVELAVSLKDKTALEEINDIYKKSNLEKPEFTAYIADQMALLGNTRGLQVPKAQPGDFGLSDARKILCIEQ